MTGLTNVILVAHILVSIVLVIVVLMQRSEGGALGIGGGGGGGGAGGGLMSGRGVAGALVRTTMIFGAIFFISSLTLTTLATKSNSDGMTDVQRDLMDGQTDAEPEDVLGVGNIDDILGADSDLLDDPLAVTPSTPSADPLEETPTEGETDPQ